MQYIFIDSKIYRPVFQFKYRPKRNISCLYVYFFFIFFSAVIFAGAAAMGVTAGAHRLWAHKCYKGKWPLRVILATLQTMAFQNHIYEWVRDHRLLFFVFNTNFYNVMISDEVLKKVVAEAQIFYPSPKLFSRFFLNQIK